MKLVVAKIRSPALAALSDTPNDVAAVAGERLRSRVDNRRVRSHDGQRAERADAGTQSEELNASSGDRGRVAVRPRRSSERPVRREKNPTAARRSRLQGDEEAGSSRPRRGHRRERVPTSNDENAARALERDGGHAGGPGDGSKRRAPSLHPFHVDEPVGALESDQQSNLGPALAAWLAGSGTTIRRKTRAVARKAVRWDTPLMPDSLACCGCGAAEPDPRVVHREDDAAVPVPGQVDHDRALAVVDVQERPAAVLAEAAALGRPERRRREADPEAEPPGGSVRPIETAAIAVYGTRTSPVTSIARSRPA